MTQFLFDAKEFFRIRHTTTAIVASIDKHRSIFLSNNFLSRFFFLSIHTQNLNATFIERMFPILFLAQPVVTTTANVIYTIPTNDPSRFTTANMTATTRVHQYGEIDYLTVVQAFLMFCFNVRSTTIL